MFLSCLIDESFTTLCDKAIKKMLAFEYEFSFSLLLELQHPLKRNALSSS